MQASSTKVSGVAVKIDEALKAVINAFTERLLQQGNTLGHQGQEDAEEFFSYLLEQVGAELALLRNTCDAILAVGLPPGNLLYRKWLHVAMPLCCPRSKEHSAR